MSDAMWFSRARLSRRASLSALLPVLSPPREDERISVGHRLLWTLFADRQDRRRDFLWREAEQGLYYILSARPPQDENGLFELDQAKPFDPRVAAGDCLMFSLRANATVARKTAGKRGERSDVVMAAIYGAEEDMRAGLRREAVQTAGLRWLQSQGERHGFELATTTDDGEGRTRVLSYRPVRINRSGKPAIIGVLDYEGQLRVADPARFIGAVKSGFGRAKAFGCGLMLLRRC